MDTEFPSNSLVFKQKESAQAKTVAVLIFLVLPLVLLWLLWRNTENQDTLIRWGTRLFVLFTTISILNKWVVPIFFSKPLTFSITSQGVMASNWLRELPWSEIGSVKVINKKAEKIVRGNTTEFHPQRVVLVFYNKTEPRKALREVVGFNLFENGEELIAALNKRLEQSVTREDF